MNQEASTGRPRVVVRRALRKAAGDAILSTMSVDIGFVGESAGAVPSTGIEGSAC
jgi:hypothetical protein